MLGLIQFTDAQKRKSKWDSAIPVTTIAQPTILTTTATLPGVVTVTTSASGSKTTVISAVGTIVKKAKQWLLCWAWRLGLVTEAIVLGREGWLSPLVKDDKILWSSPQLSFGRLGAGAGCQLCAHRNGPLPTMPLPLLAGGRTRLPVLCWRKSACKSLLINYCTGVLPTCTFGLGGKKNKWKGQAGKDCQCYPVCSRWCSRAVCSLCRCLPPESGQFWGN